MHRLTICLLFPLAAFATGCEGPSENAPPVGPRPAQGHAWVIFGNDTVVAEVADSEDEHSVGLMNRQELPAGEGMLFVFQEERTLSFYMRDTYIPLDIAFLDRSQVIVDIQQMEPLTENLHHSAEPAMFGLEVPQGWFGEQGIDVGASAQIVFGRL